MNVWCLSAHPQDIQDVGHFVSSVEYKWRFLTQTVEVCQSYNGSQWDPRLWESKKHTQTKPNKILLLVTVHWGLKTQNFLSLKLFTSDPQQCPTVQCTFTTSGARRVNVLWHSRCMRGSDLSRVYVTHCLHRRATGCCESIVYSLSRGSLWLPLYDYMTDCNGLS